MSLNDERDQRLQITDIVQESVENQRHHFSNLAQVIAAKNAIAYVGAGVSAASGLPTWHSLLRILIAETIKRLPKKKGQQEQDRLTSLLDKKRYLALADRIQSQLASERLASTIAKIIEERIASIDGRPSSLHYAVSRLPFMLFVTTNYDNLLDRAILESRSPTWNDVTGVFRAIQDHSGKDVIHSHGIVSDDKTIILTHASYRNLVHNSQSFRDCMRTLLASRAALFVGCSLSDPYLENLLEEHASRFGDHQLNHYVLWPDEENTDLSDEYWALTYGLQVLRYPMRALRRKMPRSLKISLDLQALAVERVLTILSGMVADIRSQKRGGVELDSTLLNRDEGLDTILKTAIGETGSFRGEIALLDTARSVSSPPELRLHFSHGPTIDKYTPDPSKNSYPEVERHSIIGTTFHTMPEEGAIYVSDTRNWAADRSDQRLSSGEVVECDPDLRSEYACCIYTSGEPFGVLNLESKLVDGYTEAHRTAIRRYSERAGLVCAASHALVQQNNRLLDPKESQRLKSKIREFWNAVPELDALKLDLIVYGLDYLSGSLTEASPPPGVEGFTFKFFKSNSFASSVVEKFSAVMLDDIQKGIGEGFASDHCLKRGIQGPVVGFRIRLGDSVQGLGTLAGALVVWSTLAESEQKWPQIANDLRLNFDMIQALAHLALNDMKATSNLVRGMLGACSKISANKVAAARQLAKLCGLARLRIFSALDDVFPENSDNEHQFCVVASSQSKYLKAMTNRTYTHCAYTLDRWSQNPRARRHIDREFPILSGNTPMPSGAEKFDLKPDDPWIMVPVVEWKPVYPLTSNRKRLVPYRFLGYVTADNATRRSSTIQTRTPMLRLDLLASFLRNFLSGLKTKHKRMSRKRKERRRT
jgi:hypothetical protein